MNNSHSSRPLITFALFAYNQEQYIKEAITAAFAQTYEPLEIILSDDASKDSTFQIIKDMAAAYAGPHSVRVNQSTSNRGLALHINEVSVLCSGDIVVVAAGDDISEPKRCESLARVFEQKPHVFAALSDFYVLGKGTREVVSHPITEEISNSEIFYGGGGVGAGATYAYRRELFSWPEPLPHTCMSEDRLLPARAALRGVVHKVCEPLVGYRVHEQSLNLKLKRDKKLAREDREHLATVNALMETSERLGVLKRRDARVFKLQMFLGASTQFLKRNRTPFVGVFIRVMGRSLDRFALRTLAKMRKIL